MGAFHLYNILFISSDFTPFSELHQELKKDFLSVYEYSHNAFEEYKMILQDIDFVIMRAEQSFADTVLTMKMIKTFAKAPLYLLTDHLSEDEVTHYMEQGAEGNIELPYNAKMVAARIKAVLRFLHSVERPHTNIQRLGRIQLHLDNRDISVDGRIIPLTEVEFKIVKILIEHRDVAVSKDRIIQTVWDNNDSATDNALGIHITRLRKKLRCSDGRELIETVWGLGYRINLKHCES